MTAVYCYVRTLASPNIPGSELLTCYYRVATERSLEVPLTQLEPLTELFVWHVDGVNYGNTEKINYDKALGKIPMAILQRNTTR